MSVLVQPPLPGEPSLDERGIDDVVQPTLPRAALTTIVVVAAVAAVASYFALDRNLFAPVAVGFLLYTLPVYVLARRSEGRRRATDRAWTAVVTLAFVIAVIPLVSLVVTVVTEGLARLDAEFFTSDMRGVVGEGGGGLHAIMGTLIITALATIVSVPVGVMCAIYLVEYGGKGWLARWTTFLVDVMTGIPSIVAGLFAFALFAVIINPGYRSGFMGAVALSVLMIPTVVRATEEMLKLVPNELREASYALGVQKWRTITKVVLPTALAGIVTGVMLAVARVIGETAPLLLTAGFTSTLNLNPFEGRMTTLPVFAYYSYVTPGVPPQFGYERAWTAALVLIIIVLGLNLLARFVAVKFSPKKA
jgi:phosphate transport system permease protein